MVFYNIFQNILKYRKSIQNGPKLMKGLMRPNRWPDRKIFGVGKKSGGPYFRPHRFFLTGTRFWARVHCTDGAMKVTLIKDFYLKRGGGLRLKPGTFVWRSLKSSSVGGKAIKKTFFSVFSGYIPSVFRWKINHTKKKLS